MSPVEPIELVYSLIGFPHETEWLEFKTNDTDAVRIAKDISALANAAAWVGRDKAYRIWGVDDATHELVGTSFDPLASKAKGNQELAIWLKNMLTPNANYDFEQFSYDGKNYVVLTIYAAIDQPVCFQGKAYVREGSSTTPLVAGSQKEVELWRRLQRADFEERLATEGLRLEEISELLDIEAYYSLLHLRMPARVDAAIQPLLEQNIVRIEDNGRYAVSNLGALLFARRLSAFGTLANRAIRILRFAGKGNREILDDRTIDEGYATALQRAEEHIMSFVAIGEQVDGAFRRIRYAYPQQAVRELLANMAIHQDLSRSSQGLVVGMYDNRIEFNNPGSSLVQVERVLNAQPQTRNKRLVGLLRQMDICEEGGTGWDIAVEACERLNMLPPKMETNNDLGTRVVLFAADTVFSRMSKAERLDAVYWHACLRYSDAEGMSNRSLRERFGLEDSQKNSLAMSRLIHEACEANLIHIDDETAGTRNRQYVPFWA